MAKIIDFNGESRVSVSPSPLPKLDLKDKKLLWFLSQNYRITFTMLAKLLNLSKDAVKYRIERLKEEGIILGSVTSHDVFGLGFQWFGLFFQLHNLTPTKEKKIISFLKKEERVLWVFKCGSKWDLVVWLIAKDINEFDSFRLSFNEKFNINVKEWIGLSLIKEYNYRILPKQFIEGIKVDKLEFRKEDSSFGKDFEQAPPLELDERKIKKIDSVDLKILEVFSVDARASLFSISRKLKITPDKVRYRIKGLIKKGVLQAFWPLVSVSKLGFQWNVVLLKLRKLDKKSDKALEYFFKNSSSTPWASRTFGNYDIVAHVFAKDQQHFYSILEELREKFGDIIQETDFLLMFEEFKYTNFSKELYKALK